MNAIFVLHFPEEIHDSFFPCVFILLHSFCFLHVSVSYLFVWDSPCLSCPRVSSDIQKFCAVCSCLCQWKVGWKSCAHALGFVADCGLYHIASNWAFSFFFFFFEKTQCYVFSSSLLCWLHPPRKNLLVSCLLTGGGYRTDDWSQLGRSQRSYQPVCKFPQYFDFHCETPSHPWTVSSSFYYLLHHD